MNLLIDTHLLIWAAEAEDKVPAAARALMADDDNTLYFSVASIWELAIKSASNRRGLEIDPRALRQSLLNNDYEELTITSPHALATDMLPLIHRDPFDRILVAQAMVEGFTLLTVDATVARYPGSIILG